VTACLTDDQLRALAEDAFEVMNWARRLGLRREAQIAEVVKAFEVRLGYRKAVVTTAPTALETAARMVGGSEL
jgi:hypothetical protein